MRENRNASKYKPQGQTLATSPDNGALDTSIARKYAYSQPSIILLRQNGKSINGWSGTPFWWPILISPKNIEKLMFPKISMKQK